MQFHVFIILIQPSSYHFIFIAIKHLIFFIQTNKFVSLNIQKFMKTEQQIKTIRIASKQSQDLMTVDSPSRRTRSGIKNLHHTIQFMKRVSQTKSSFYPETQKLWRQSASSMIRESSPSHQFPRAQRFSSLAQDERKNKIILKLNLGGQLSNSKGISFAKSKRIDHFKPKKYYEDYPSAASYGESKNVESRRLSTGQGKKRSLLARMCEQVMHSDIKGVTIPKQKHPQKIFLHHGQNLPYHPQITKYNPGVGRYHLNQQRYSLTTRKFHLGQTLRKFNQFAPRHPGPGAYDVDKEIMTKRVKSANAKGTFPLSKRTYLVEKHIEEYSPAPDNYKLKRFLQK